MASSLEIMNAANIAFLLNKPIFQSQQASAQNIASGFTGTAITLSSPILDTYSGWSAGNPTRYTAKVAGYYLVIGQIGFATNTSGNRVMQILRNGSISALYGSMAVPTCNTTSFNTALNTSGLIFMNGTTDYVEMWGYQDSGSTLATIANGTFVTIIHVHQ